MGSQFITQIVYYVKIGQSLCLKVFYKRDPIQVPIRFVAGRYLCLTNWLMMPNLVSYLTYNIFYGMFALSLPSVSYVRNMTSGIVMGASNLLCVVWCRRAGKRSVLGIGDT